VAFKVYNYHDEQQRADKERRDKTKFQMLAQALQLTKPGKIPNASQPMFSVWP
jgi:hypothetical protein